MQPSLDISSATFSFSFIYTEFQLCTAPFNEMCNNMLSTKQVLVHLFWSLGDARNECQGFDP